MTTNDRRTNEALDANLSVLGDEGKEPHVGRVGQAPRPDETSNLEEELADGKAGSGDGNLDQDSQRAARETIADVANRAAKG